MKVFVATITGVTISERFLWITDAFLNYKNLKKEKCMYFPRNCV